MKHSVNFVLVKPCKSKWVRYLTGYCSYMLWTFIACPYTSNFIYFKSEISLCLKKRLAYEWPIHLRQVRICIEIILHLEWKQNKQAVTWAKVVVFIFSLYRRYIYTNVHMPLNIWTEETYYLHGIHKLFLYFENKETHENRTNKQTNKYT